MKKFTILGIALCGWIVQGQTVLDNNDHDRNLTKSLFANPPASSVVTPPPGKTAPPPAIIPGQIKLRGGGVILGRPVKVIPETVEIATANGTIQMPINRLDDDYVLAVFPTSDDAISIQAVRGVIDIGKAVLSAAEKPQPTPEPTQSQSDKPLKPGLNIVSFESKEISREFEHSTIAWKVELLNNSDDPISNIYVHFSFRDKDSFELEDAIEADVSLKPGEKKTVTSTSMMKSDIWDKVDRYDVKTD